MSQFRNWENLKLAGQCVMPRLNTEEYFTDLDYKYRIEELVRIGIGGFCVFGGDTDNVPKMIEKLQSLSEIPLIFSSDFENGLQMRLTEGTSFPHAMALGKTNNAENSLYVGKAIAKEAKSIGINWNFAPVCDINNNPKNPIINIRSFGENAKIVSEFAINYIKGSQSENVASCAKHFPGHGDTETDSHVNLPFLDKTLDDLKRNELIPFISALENDVWSVMVGHLAVKAFNNDKIPASLSKNVINYLRNELNFNGIILTDALDMNAVINYTDKNIAPLTALLCGNDIALLPAEPVEAIKNITEELDKNESFRNQIEKSVQRIYNLKRKVGLIPQFAKSNNSNQVFNEHLKKALKLGYEALIISGNRELIPLNEKSNFAGFAVLQTDKDLQSANRFFTMLAQATENDCDFGFIDVSITNEQIIGFKDGVKDSEIVIFAVFYKSRAYHNLNNNNSIINNVIKELSQNKKLIIIRFGSPYIEIEAESDLEIYTFSDSFASLAAAVVSLSGRTEALDF